MDEKGVRRKEGGRRREGGREEEGRREEEGADTSLSYIHEGKGTSCVYKIAKSS